MNFSSLFGNAPRQETKPAFAYTAQVTSTLVDGEARLSITEKALSIVVLFDAVEVSYAEVNAIQIVDHVVIVRTDIGDYSFARMGQWAQPFYDALYAAYNKAVLRALFIDGDPLFTATGDVRYAEKDATGSVHAPIQIRADSVVFLPPDLGARRVPLHFVTGMTKGTYECSLRLDSGENYAFAKLGYDTAIFADAVEKQLRDLREKTLRLLRSLDATLTAAQVMQLARIMPDGAAAPIGSLMAIAPSFVAALEAGIERTRAVSSYRAFRELGTLAHIWIGFRKNSVATGTANLTDAIGNLMDGKLTEVRPIVAKCRTIEAHEESVSSEKEGATAESLPSEPYLFWFIAPSPDGAFAVVEFSAADSATFVYRTDGDFDGFAKQFNHALEAIAFKREVIRLSDAELHRPENVDYYMAARRTASLQFVRAHFADRVIHSSPEAWRKKLRSIWETGDTKES